MGRESSISAWWKGINVPGGGTGGAESKDEVGAQQTVGRAKSCLSRRDGTGQGGAGTAECPEHQQLMSLGIKSRAGGRRCGWGGSQGSCTSF